MVWFNLKYIQLYQQTVKKRLSFEGENYHISTQYKCFTWLKVSALNWVICTYYNHQWCDGLWSQTQEIGPLPSTTFSDLRVTLPILPPLLGHKDSDISFSLPSECWGGVANARLVRITRLGLEYGVGGGELWGTLWPLLLDNRLGDIDCPPGDLVKFWSPRPLPLRILPPLPPLGMDAGLCALVPTGFSPGKMGLTSNVHRLMLTVPLDRVRGLFGLMRRWLLGMGGFLLPLFRQYLEPM